MSQNNYKFFNNKECEYFPCHKVANPDDFNCLFCYCPLYMLEDKCGGNFRYTAHGVKDCSNCTIVHTKDVGYDHVQKKMMTVIEIVMENHLKKADLVEEKETKKKSLAETFKKREVKFEEDRNKDNNKE